MQIEMNKSLNKANGFYNKGLLNMAFSGKSNPSTLQGGSDQ